jgi:hypothetical protein
MNKCLYLYLRSYLAQMTKLLNCIQQVQGSNFGLDIDYIY